MDTHIAFTGFPQAGLKFLSDLAAHNERTWFEAQKEEYQKTLLAPAQAFVMDLGVKLQSLSNGIYYDTRTDGRGVLMRIHRDIRFSQDTIPILEAFSGRGIAKRMKVQHLVFKSMRRE